MKKISLIISLLSVVGYSGFSYCSQRLDQTRSTSVQPVKSESVAKTNDNSNDHFDTMYHVPFTRINLYPQINKVFDDILNKGTIYYIAAQHLDSYALQNHKYLIEEFGGLSSVMFRTLTDESISLGELIEQMILEMHSKNRDIPTHLFFESRLVTDMNSRSSIAGILGKQEELSKVNKNYIGTIGLKGADIVGVYEVVKSFKDKGGFAKIKIVSNK